MLSTRTHLFRTVRTFSTTGSPIILSKASKARTTRKSTPDRLRGTGVGASSKVYADSEVVGKPSPPPTTQAKEGSRIAELEQVTDAVEAELEKTPKGAQEKDTGLLEDDSRYGTLVGPGNARDEGSDRVHEPAPPSSEPAPTSAEGEGEGRVASIAERKAALEYKQQAYDAYSPEETIYTAKPPFPPALWLTAAFVFAVFSLNGAEIARVGVETIDEESGEVSIAPKWKRYTFATGFAAVGLGAVVYGALVPARIITKLNIRKPPSSTVLFPHDSLIIVHTPISRLPLLSPRTIPLNAMTLLGPLSRSPKPWHPRVFPARPQKSSGIFARIGNTLFPASPANLNKPVKSPWQGAPKSHTPLMIIGDRASYTLAREGKEAWALDWEALERALLEGKSKVGKDRI